MDTHGAPVAALTVDLDDTLYPQAEWLDGAWASVADSAGRRGLDRAAVHSALLRVCAGGSDGGGIVDRALVAVGVPPDRVAELVPGLVAVFADHRPARLTPYPGVVDALERLAGRLPVVVVTDGMPPVQHAKVAALGLEHLVAGVVVSDELGGRCLRKPHAAPFRHALGLLGQPAAAVVHVGDRPEKDVRGAMRVGMRAVRVTTGEYAGRTAVAPDLPWATVGSFAEAVDLCLAAAAGTDRAAARL